MKLIVRLIFLAVLVALGFWLWSVFFPNPEKIIRDRLNKLAHLASFAGNEGNITRVASVESLGTYFTDDVEVALDVPNYETHTFTHRDEITQAAMAARSAISSLQVDFPDINVDVAADKLSAIANVTLRADINGDKNAVIQELKISLKKVNGDWLIYRVDTVRTLH
jgi:hypothetical protein